MKPKLDIIIFGVALIAAGLMADAWHSARHDSQQLAATLAAQSAQIQQAHDRENERDSQLAAALAAIKEQKRAVRTPEQAAEQLASVLPPLPLPVSIPTVNLSPLTPSAETPTESTIISIPKPDLVPLYDALQDCRANAAQNNSLQKDLSDEKTRSTALQHERDAALAAAHGGTFLLRLKRAAKWFAIGLAAGAAATAATRR
jgi:hypothetical protein